MGFGTGLLIGLITGWLTMAYMSIPAFRNRLNAIVRVAIKGDKPKTTTKKGEDKS